MNSSTRSRAKLGHLEENIVHSSPGHLRGAFPDVDGEYELSCSAFLAQATGRCSDFDFCFWAKHGEWEFEVVDQFGHSFPMEDQRRFIGRGSYDRSKPGVLSLEWAAEIIRKCISEWWS